VNEEREKEKSGGFDVLSAVQNLHGKRCSTHMCRGFLHCNVSVRATFGQQNTSYGSSCQPSAVLWVAATMARNSA